MKIEIRKVNDMQHELCIVRANGTYESVTCDTRNFLKHDLLHYAVESEAGLAHGFWGLLAAGKTFEDLNDRTGKSIADRSDQIMIIEAVVGVLHPIAKIESIYEFIEGLRSQGKGLGWTMPDWFNKEFVSRIQERMRQINGQWKATGYGKVMTLFWE